MWSATAVMSAVRRGAAGSLMEGVATLLHWFEEHLVLKGGDEGLFNLVQRLGSGLVKVEVAAE